MLKGCPRTLSPKIRQLFMTIDDHFLQVNLTNANLEGALATGNTSFKGSIITGAGKQNL